MFALNDKGKTKILYLLVLGKEVINLPTLGFNVEIIDMGGKNIKIFDIGGLKQLRGLWNHYLKNINGLIWVYDISNNQTYEESQNELKKLLNDPQMTPDIPLLIFANKNDINVNGNQAEDFINDIQDVLNGRSYYIKECNHNDLDSYKDGINWLSNSLID